jgi:hypothetical protein
VQGPIGPKGEAFTIKKTYTSVAEMNADFNNMQLGDYVMIASTVEVEDNAKLYTRGESQWIFISDFSGATGIRGETGLTPNIQIGTVTSGETPNVTRTGTNENPVLNFTLVKGDKGDTGSQGIQGETGVGIASITKTSSEGLVDTYTITYTDGTTSTFQITNGEDGETPLSDFNALKDRVSDLEDNQLHDDKEGTEIYIDDAHDSRVDRLELEKESSQETKILPNGYTQVDYIETTGTQYISSNYRLTSSQLEIDTKLYIPTLPVRGEQDIVSNQDNTTNRFVFGLYQSHFFGYSRTGSSTADTSVYSADLTAPNIFKVNLKYDYANQLKTMIVNGNTTTEIQNSEIAPSNNPIRLFSTATGATGLFTGRIYYLRLKDNGVLVRDFIPCFRNSDNEVGLYDYVNDVFYTNSGTGVFTYGSVVEVQTEDFPTPTPDYPQEVKTVKGIINYFNSNVIQPRTNSGVELTIKDQIIHLQGTSTGTSNFYIKSGESFTIPAGTYYLSRNSLVGIGTLKLSSGNTTIVSTGNGNL